MKNDFSNVPQFGGFTEGLLAGAKLRALKEEVEFSRLQRAEYEGTAAYRDSMRQLDMAKSQNELRRGESNLLLDELIRTQREQMFPLELGSAKAGLDLTKAQTRGVTADADVAEATKDSRIGQSKSQATISQQAALGAQLNNLQNVGTMLQRGSKTFTPGDYLSLAKAMGSPEGAPSETMAMLLGSEIEGLQKEYATNQAQLAAAKQQDSYVQLGQTISALANLGPAAEALRGQGLFPDAVIDAVTGGSGRLTRDQQSALSGIDKALANTYDQLGTIQGQLTPYETRKAGGEKLSNSWFGKDDATDYAKLKETLQEVQGKQQFLENERARVVEGKKPQVQRETFKDKPARQSIATVLDGFVFDREPTDADLKEIVDFLKAKGITASKSEIEAYIKSRSK